MVLSTVVLVAALLGIAVCDYSCLCNYNIELGVLGKDLSTTIGYLYEFDCKATIQDISTTNYTAIAYEHEVGYIQKNNEIQLQTCAGDPSTDDIGTTQQTAAFNTTSMQTKTPKQATKVQPKATVQFTAMPPIATDKATTMTPPTAKIATTMQPSITETVTTMQRTTAEKATTNQPTTTERATTKQSTTTVQATTTLPKTTDKATTIKPTNIELSTKLTMMPVSSPIPTTTPSPVNNGVCPQIVQEHARDDNNIIATLKNKCYEVMVEGLVSWNNAELDCKKRGGHLLDIANIDEQHFINKLLSNNSFSYNLWIGLNDRHHEEQFEWISRNNITFTNWLPGRKSTFFHSTEDCVYLSPHYNGQWEDVSCNGLLSRGHHFMCQYITVDPGSIVITTLIPSAEGNTKLCLHHNINHAKQFGGTLAQYEHSCYELLPNNKYTWSHGESICHSHGGDLAHISSSAEQDFIQAFMTRHSPRHAVWIGLHDLGREGHFEWTSGTPVTYLNWLPGHISNFVSHDKEDCVLFIPYQNGTWDDVPCGDQGLFGGDEGETHPILCQYNTVTNAIIG